MPNTQATGVAFADPPMIAGATVNAGLSSASGRLAGMIVEPAYSSTGQGNGADTTDDVLFTYAIPPNAFDSAGRALTITGLGKFASNGNNKRVKVWFGTTTQTLGSAVAGGTLIADSGTVTTNNGGWSLTATVTKYGATGSNTQVGQGAVIAGGSHTGTILPAALTATESGVINITVTGSSGTSGAASDVVGQMFGVSFQN